MGRHGPVGLVGSRLFAPLLVVLSLQACARSQTPARCETAAECASDARCVGGACVVNAPPSPAVELPSGAIEANRLLTFDASSSLEPDHGAGDSIAAYAWEFRAIAAPCDPPAVAGIGPTATVRFACPGTYAVSVTATDEMQASAVATREFEVALYSGPTLVQVSPSPGLLVQHACTANPRRCAPVGEIVLSATATADAPDGLSFEWSVEPPADRPLDETRRVTFDPGPDVASPRVLVETDGQAISGDWVFHLVAYDASGVVASGVTTIGVGNRKPVVTVHGRFGGDHAFDGTKFTASGYLVFSVADPDGDDLVGRTIEGHHVNDGAGSTFELVETANRVDYAISVPYESPADAAHLIGGAGLERSIVFSVVDANGGVTTETSLVEVKNRPPVATTPTAPLTVDHRYSIAAAAYEAEAPLSTWTDPDGDPLTVVPRSSTGDAACARVAIQNGVASVGCSVPFTDAPVVNLIAGTHTVKQHVQDPWVEPASPQAVTFTVANRAPTIDAATNVGVPVTCSFAPDVCCAWERDPETGARTYVCGGGDAYGSGTTLVTSRWHDPDGDPLSVVVGGAAAVCTPGACAFDVTFPGAATCGGIPTVATSTTATDGVATASASFSVVPACP